MTPASAAWAIALVVIGAMVALSIVHRRVAVPMNRIERLVRSPEHQTKVEALREWLTEPRIVRVLLESRVATGEGLQKTLEELDTLSHEEASATVGLLLARRDVRLVVAGFMQKRYGHNKAEVLHALMEWAQPVRQEVGA